MSWSEKLRDLAERHWKVILFSSVVTISFSAAAIYLMSSPAGGNGKRGGKRSGGKAFKRSDISGSDASVEDAADSASVSPVEEDEDDDDSFKRQLDSPPIGLEDQKFGISSFPHYPSISKF